MPKFENPYLLFLLIIIVPYIAWYIIWGRKSKANIQISSLQAFSGIGKGIRYYLQHLPFVLRCITIALIIIALARPRSSMEIEHTSVEGIDIMLIFDVSSSMLARDFTPDRISAAKNIGIEFVSQRMSDRIGLTVFAGESFIQCPLTNDKATLINQIARIETDLIEDGTAIGNGLALAVSRLKESEAKSKVAILLTDGVNNRGSVDPVSAADIAKLYGVRTYTIGIGANGTAPYPMMGHRGIQMVQVPVEIDEPLLKDIAKKTGGKYFRATSNTKLVDIYNEIDQLEKTKSLVDAFPVYKEEFMPLALAAFALLILEILVRLLVLRRIP